ncbi:MAG TPA: hypothetical protein PKJ97_04200 [Candidatus Bilamarchaeaceae archaeon]|nr:hypothetical protein [Candidatus Bilamarchaeaceae archaeon]
MKNKALSILLGILGVAVIIGSVYYALTYFSYLGNLLISFFSANSAQDFSRCGIFVPEGFGELRDQIATTILPMVYLGVPLVLLLMSALMFGSGYYFGRHRSETESLMVKRREEDIKREVERRVANKPVEEEGGEALSEEEPSERKPSRPSRKG